MTDNEKDVFYYELTETSEGTTGNAIKIVSGDFNVKCGREPLYFLFIGKASLHNNSNDSNNK